MSSGNFSRLRRFGEGAIRWLVPLLVSAFLVAGCGGNKEEAIPRDSHVLALGDSLTAGAGVSPEEAWPARLSRQTGWMVINGGVSGDTTADGLRRLPALLDEHSPVLVLVALGGNDMLRHAPREETVANLEQILSLIQARGAKAVLLATPQPSVAGAVFRNLSAAEFYREIAEKRHVPLVEDAIADVLSKPELKGDPLHPNAAGHALLAEKIYEALRSIGYIR